MNKTIKFIILFSVVAILPSVAVADVIVGGIFTGSATSTTPPVTLQPGSNYMQAQQLGLIYWSPSVYSTMGELHINGSSTMNETMANVLDLNTSYESLNGGATIYVNVTSSNFISGILYITNSPMNLTEVSTGEFHPGVLIGQLSLTGGSVSFPSSNPSGSGASFYIGFYLPFGHYKDTSFEITVQYVAIGGS